jgi:hypothetical protein
VYSGAAFYFYATLDLLQLAGCNDPISIDIGDPEGCHLPWCIHLVLEMWCGKRKVIGITSKIVCNSESSFLLSAFLRGSSTKSTQLPIFSCLMEPNKTKNEVWFISCESNVLDYLVKSRCFFKHRN